PALLLFFFFSSRRRHTRSKRDWSSDVCSSDLTLHLIGGAKGPRDAIGAKAFLTVGGIAQRNDVISGGSYISNNDMRLHFGIGKAKQVDKLEIRWPDGIKENVALTGVNRVYRIVEGKGATEERLE